VVSVGDVGVLARDPYVLHTVAKVLLQQPELEWGLPSEVLVADDCFGLSTISSVRTADLLSRAVTDTLGLRLIITVYFPLCCMPYFDNLIYFDRELVL
jgi:amidase